MTLHRSARQWSGDGARAAGFSTRNQGHNLARKVWICQACRRWHEAERPTEGQRPAKPVACRDCGASTWLYFDSAGEAQHFARLYLLMEQGQVRGLKHHPRFALVTVTPALGLEVIGHYEADMEYQILVSGVWERRIDDYKPKSAAAQDPLFKWKRRHFEAQTGREIRIVS